MLGVLDGIPTVLLVQIEQCLAVRVLWLASLGPSDYRAAGAAEKLGYVVWGNTNEAEFGDDLRPVMPGLLDR